MNSSSNLLVLGATGQVGKLVAKNLKRRKATFSVGSRREANLEELADQFGASRFIDLDDPRTFDEALKNVTGIFLITGYTVDMLVQSKITYRCGKTLWYQSYRAPRRIHDRPVSNAASDPWQALRIVPLVVEACSRSRFSHGELDRVCLPSHRFKESD